MPAAKKTAANKTAPEPDPIVAAEAEAGEEPTTFEFNGIEFTVPPFSQLPLELLYADNELEAVTLVVGEEQWAEFRKAKPTIADFQALTVLVNEASAGSGN